VYVPPNDPRELGLTGVAVDPDWPDHPFVYLYYTADNVRRTMIERVRIDEGETVERKEIISWRARPSCCHIGGGMAFLPDGTLLVAVGDHQRPPDAQDPSTPPGSILHITRDGAAVAGDGIDGPAYAYGLRNPFDVAVDSSTGRAFAGENGDAGQDAIIEVQPGANYGWPGTGLRVSQDEILGPMQFYNDALGLAGMTFYRGRPLGELDGRLLFCQYNGGGALRSREIEDGGTVGSERVVAPGCTSDVGVGADGFVYFLNYEAGTLYRISKP
jgi:glucose/arabinose dehydrogenase